MKQKDQLVAPQPVVAFASPEAEHAVKNNLFFQLRNSTEASLKHDEVAFQRSEEIARRQGDINQAKDQIRQANDFINRLEAENSQAHVERRDAEQASQTHLDVAKGAADTLVALGASIPGDLAEVLRNGNVGRLKRHHDELNGGQP